MEARMIKNVIDFQKAAFDNSFSAMAMLQDQAERTGKMFLESSIVPIPEEGKKIMDEWVQAFKKGRDEFKRAVDESYRKMEESLSMREGGEETGRAREKTRGHA